MFPVKNERRKKKSSFYKSSLFIDCWFFKGPDGHNGNTEKSL